jgi:hypothetical protein
MVTSKKNIRMKCWMVSLISYRHSKNSVLPAAIDGASPQRLESKARIHEKGKACSPAEKQWIHEPSPRRLCAHLITGKKFLF